MTNYPYYSVGQNALYQRFPSLDQTQQQLGIKGRPVSSIDEVRAISIDFDGSVFYFPDLAHNHIYTKQINPDGTNTLNIYELIKPAPEPQPPSYVTREEFNATLNQLLEKFAGTEVVSATKEAETPPPPQAPAVTQKFNF